MREGNKICLLVHSCNHSKYMWSTWLRYWKENFKPYVNWIDTVFLIDTYCEEVEQLRKEDIIVEFTNEKDWATGLINYLTRCNYEYTIYHHEDYLIVEKVNENVLSDLYNTMGELDLPLIKCCGWWGGYIDAKAPYIMSELKTINNKEDLWVYNNESMYLTSHQSSIWNTDFLKSTLQKGENAWGHELGGTKRLRLRKEYILAYRKKAPIEYAEIIHQRRLRPDCQKWLTEDEFKLFNMNGVIK